MTKRSENFWNIKKVKLRIEMKLTAFKTNEAIASGDIVEVVDGEKAVDVAIVVEVVWVVWVVGDVKLFLELSQKLSQGEYNWQQQSVRLHSFVGIHVILCL